MKYALQSSIVVMLSFGIFAGCNAFSLLNTDGSSAGVTRPPLVWTHPQQASDTFFVGNTFARRTIPVFLKVSTVTAPGHIPPI